MDDAILLDTHALIWALYDPARLSRAARERLADGAVRIAASAVSAYEIALKYRLGRLGFAASLVQRFEAELMRLHFTVLPLTAEHARQAGLLSMVHRDPFDRMLCAQSIVERLPIVSRDVAMDRLGAVRIW